MPDHEGAGTIHQCPLQSRESVTSLCHLILPTWKPRSRKVGDLREVTKWERRLEVAGQDFCWGSADSCLACCSKHIKSLRNPLRALRQLLASAQGLPGMAQYLPGGTHLRGTWTAQTEGSRPPVLLTCPHKVFGAASVLHTH